MPALIDWVLALLIFAGALFCLAGAIGAAIARQIHQRIESVAKSVAAGAAILLLAGAIAAGDLAIFLRAAAAAFFVLANSIVFAMALGERAFLAALLGRLVPPRDVRN